MSEATESGVALHSLAPLLFVEDMRRSLRFYREALGSTVKSCDHADVEQSGWCMLQRGGVAVMLQRITTDRFDGKRGQGVELYIGCDDVDALHAEIVARGIDAKPPKTAYYGMRQLYVKDPDGYQLWFQHAVKRGGAAS